MRRLATCLAILTVLASPAASGESLSPVSAREAPGGVRRPNLFAKPLERFRVIRDRMRATRAGRTVMRGLRQVRRGRRIVQANLTHLADRLESRLGPRGTRRMRAVRAYNPLSLPAFTLYKFARDPLFLGGYAATSSVVSHAVQGALLKLGCAVGPVLIIPKLVGLPLDLGVIIARENHLHPGETVRDTAKRMTVEYRDLVERKRDDNRRVYAVLERARARAR